jgi:AraC family transcriptional regulator
VKVLARHEVFGPVERAEYGPVAIAITEYAAQLRLRPHCHTDAYVTFVSRGGYAERTHRETRYCTEGAVLIHGEGEVHDDAFLPVRTRCVNVFVDRSWRWGLGAHDMLGSPVMLPPSSATRSIMHRLETEIRSPDDVTPIVIQSLILEVMVLLRRASTTRDAPAWLRHASAFLTTHFAEPLGLQDVALAVGIHPAQVARAFREHFGMSVGEKLRAIRVDYACRQLQSKEPLVAIARDAGFADQSHFTRVFRRIIGDTPAAYRRNLRRM